MAKAQNYIGGGGDAAPKTVNREGGTPHILSLWGEQLGWGHRTILKENTNDKIHRMKTRAVENTKYNLQIQKDLKSIIVIQKIQEY